MEDQELEKRIATLEKELLLVIHSVGAIVVSLQTPNVQQLNKPLIWPISTAKLQQAIDNLLQ